MPHAHRACTAGLASWAQLAAIATLAMAITGSTGLAQNTRIEDLVSAVVRIKTHINPEGRTVEGLGREREGSGIVIDNDGLVLTIGYLMVEAYAAEVVDNSGRTVPANVVGYDHETGFGLLRTMEPLKLKPMPLGKSADVKERDPVLVASFGGADMVARRLRRRQARVRRQLGIPARRGAVHRAAASGLERGGADQPRGQAGRRRLADRRRRHRRERQDARQHVRADRPAVARSSATSSPTGASPGRGGRGSASTPTSCAGACSSAA